jgi:hypothetical protein
MHVLETHDNVVTAVQLLRQQQKHVFLQNVAYVRSVRLVTHLNSAPISPHMSG